MCVKKSMLRSILKENRSAIAERWLAETLASYQSSAAEFFRHTKDPFANPVGNALVRGMMEVLECLLAGKPIESVRGNLDEVIRIRAVQDFSPSQAVSFVFLLKSAIRRELGGKIDEQGLAADLAEFESKIDQVALLAFEIYVHCREQVYQLRVDEVKRSVSGIMTRFGRKGFKPDSATKHGGERDR
ncbi:MAG: hypothetical protein A4E57_04432 [Syntrophorhabdaceae bacterium PtaU1.Bin034]|jgi:hypothetical protein|nr:MAG: hypothetical protein A4E57_04432 [Syntrophorhabdaceae bacterium PtaU1.Bin034]